MKAFITACTLLALIGLFVGIHSVTMISTAEDILEKCNTVTRLSSENNWKEAAKEIDIIEKKLKKNRIWSSLTTSAKNIEEIETALNRSRAFAVLEQKPDFVGEFALFQNLIQRIPAREGFRIEEIL